MHKFKKVTVSLLAIAAAFALVGCSGAKTETQQVKIGVVGENNEVWEFVAEKLATENIEVELVPFTDYAQPNNALAEGELDLNSFQHQAFLDAYNADSGTELISIGNTVFAPLGVYSEQIETVDEIVAGDTIAIPNDVTNGGRALLLLQSAGLITIDPQAGAAPTVADITDNPLNLEISELDAAQTARAVSDVKASVINSGMAVDAGYVPTKDAVYLEKIDDSSQPYVNIIAARPEDAENKLYQKVVDAYQQEDTKEVITTTSAGSQLAGW